MAFSYSEKREPDDAWVAKVSSWIEETGEVFIYLRYLFNSPTMNFALVRSEHDLRRLIGVSPEGTELTACRGAWLPIRGAWGEELLDRVRDEIPTRTDCVCVFTQTNSPEDPRLAGESWCSTSEMIRELSERECEQVAIGVFVNDGRETISAAIGGLDGPR
jgi:hypothetical protein